MATETLSGLSDKVFEPTITIIISLYIFSYSFGYVRHSVSEVILQGMGS